MLNDRIRIQIRPFTTSVFLRIAPYTVTEIYNRNTGPCNTPKHGRIRSVYSMYTVVYGVVYDRKRAFTESVTIDLGPLVSSTEERVL